MSGNNAEYLLAFIRSLTTAISNSLLYSPEHHQVTRLCESAHKDLLAAIANDQELSLLLIDDELIYKEHPLPYSMYQNRFCQALKNRGISHLRLMGSITRNDIMMLIKMLSSPVSSLDEIRSSDNVRFGKVGIRLISDESSDSNLPGRIISIPDVPFEELATFMEIYEEARQNKKINIVGISDIVSCFISTFKQVSDPLLALAPLRAMDEYTFTHSTNVCILNLAQAMSLGINGPLLNDIGIAAMLHDLGKLYVPEEVLSKPGKLDDREWELIKQHPVKGAERLLNTPGVPRLAVVTAYEHHMKFNLSGYPSVSPGWKQNLCSQMTTISDFFDALRTKRAYRDSMEFSKIAGIMMEISGSDLHPVLTRNFLSIISRLSDYQQPPTDLNAAMTTPDSPAP